MFLFLLQNVLFWNYDSSKLGRWHNSYLRFFYKNIKKYSLSLNFCYTFCNYNGIIFACELKKNYQLVFDKYYFFANIKQFNSSAECAGKYLYAQLHIGTKSVDTRFAHSSLREFPDSRNFILLLLFLWGFCHRLCCIL